MLQEQAQAQRCSRGRIQRGSGSGNHLWMTAMLSLSAAAVKVTMMLS
jgi:hypothetical protein